MSGALVPLFENVEFSPRSRFRGPAVPRAVFVERSECVHALQAVVSVERFERGRGSSGSLSV